MSPETFIFIGRSGCGKGTQAKLLIDMLKARDHDRDVFYLETGAQFRELIKKPTFTSSLAYDIYKSGELQPSFLAIHVWSHEFIAGLNGRQHMVLDGTPRGLGEAMILDGALRFYQRVKPTIVYMNVSNTWSQERLRDRKRSDDRSEDEVTKRLAWFDKDVMPAVEYFRNESWYNFVEVNGEQSIEKVWTELREKIGML